MNVYRSCCVCKKVEYEGELVDESVLEQKLGKENYKLSHTYLSKSCLLQYFEDIKHGSAYKKLPEKCEK